MPINTNDVTFAADVLSGLSKENKSLSSRYFYDATGDRLFQGIMESPEYYLTDCELEIFERQGDDLYCEVPIHFTTAACGGSLDIPTLNGQVKLKIPSETQTGRMFRLRGKGVKSVRSHRQGDLLCKIVIETPVKLSREQKDLLQQFQDSYESSNTEHNPKSSSWLNGVKDFFDRMTM